MTLAKPTPSARPLLSEVADVFGCSTGYLRDITDPALIGPDNTMFWEDCQKSGSLGQ